MTENLQEKMDRYNEMLLRSTALTFSSEGISKDIRGLVSKKAEFVSEMLTGMAALIESVKSSKMSAQRQKVIDEMLCHALVEVRTVNSTISYLIAKQFEKESLMSISDQPESKETPQEKHKTKDKRPKKQD